MTANMDVLKQDLINKLPDDCIHHIFTFLPASLERYSCAAVSKKWLKIQAKMQNRHFRPQQIISQSLDGEADNDICLAAVLVGRSHPRGILTQLTLTSNITDSGLEIVGQACPSLKTLVLWSCLQVTDNGVIAVASGCRHALEKLELSDLPLVGDRSLIAIANHCKKMKSISVLRSSNLGNDIGTGIIAVVSALPELADLKLVRMKLGDHVLRAIGERGRKLRFLLLEKIWGPSEIAYAWIGEAKQMEYLCLRSCMGLSFKRFGRDSFVGLKNVIIKNCTSLMDEGLLHLSKSTSNLVELTLELCGRLTKGGLMQALANWSKTLKGLALVKCDIIDQVSHDYLQLPCLKTLMLIRCQGVGDDFLIWMGGACKGVKHVELVGLGGAITHRGLFALLDPFAGWAGLEYLDLSGCWRITSWSVVSVLGAYGETMKTLRLEGCKGLSDGLLGMIGELCPWLKELDLTGCDMSDDGVVRLAETAPSGLQVLSLADSAEITDRSLEIMEVMCGTLEGLNLQGCPGLTKSGIDSIKEMLFWCDIIS